MTDPNVKLRDVYLHELAAEWLESEAGRMRAGISHGRGLSIEDLEKSKALTRLAKALRRCCDPENDDRIPVCRVTVADKTAPASDL